MAITKQHYRLPFAGKPAALERAGLFLFAPSVELKLAGTSVRTQFVNEGQESLFKRIETGRKERKPPSQAIADEVLALIPQGPGKN